MEEKTGYEIRTGSENMDAKAVHDFLSKESYWAKEIPFSTVEQSLKNSYCAGVFTDGRQIGFARLITDYSTFAYLADVYILREHRGKRLSEKLMEHLMNAEWAGSLRRIVLATSDAHGLYKKFGFTALERPESFMEIKRDRIYKDKN